MFVLGVLTQEVTGKLSKVSKGQYVLSSYTNMVETAGAHVVPFLYPYLPHVGYFTCINFVRMLGFTDSSTSLPK